MNVTRLSPKVWVARCYSVACSRKDAGTWLKVMTSPNGSRRDRGCGPSLAGHHSQLAKRDLSNLPSAGFCYDDIAGKIGYANRGTACAPSNGRFMSERLKVLMTTENPELARLDALQAAHWEAATKGMDGGRL